MTSVILADFGFLWLLFWGVFAWISHQEGERRATRIALMVASGGAIIFWGAVALPLSVQWGLLGIITFCGVTATIFFFLPIGNVDPGNDIPRHRFDERQIMFARNRLQPDSPEFRNYYSQYPEHLTGDERTRSQPGLLSPQAKYANLFHFAATNGSFDLTHALRDAVDGPEATTRIALPTNEMTAYIQKLAHFYGALEVGITELQPYHVYSHIGRGTGTLGAPIQIEHTHAIAFTVEMDFKMVGTAPKATLTMETAREYVEAARVAVQLANAIRNMGYAARAHIDGNYQVIAPLVARDAGLGEIGRMTLLMTPREGPRIRLGVVTTDLKLTPSPRQPIPAVIDFCNICKKCAENCPSRSIPFSGRQEIDGALRWKLNEETCFRYWNAVGTDCGRCMAVCPYSHPNNLMHYSIRWGIARSGAFRRFALWMDNLFYGKCPEEREAPTWTRIS